VLAGVCKKETRSCEEKKSKDSELKPELKRGHEGFPTHGATGKLFQKEQRGNYRLVRGASHAKDVHE
jgi:hypothetical protein